MTFQIGCMKCVERQLHLSVFFTIWLQINLKGCQFSSHWDHCFNSLMALGKLFTTSVLPSIQAKSEFESGCARDMCCCANVICSLES